jgi:DNA-binding transcriptional ArsR family regulator
MRGSAWKASEMSDAELSPLLVDPTRLNIVSLLAATEWAEFGWVRDSVGMSDSALSKQVTTLGKSGYVEMRKGYVGKRPRTWLSLSDAGREALRVHIAALQRIAEQSQRAGQAHRAQSGEPPA